MGLQDRDWYREPRPSRGGRTDRTGIWIVAVVLAGLVVAGGALHVLRGPQPSFEGERRTVTGDTKIGLLPGLAITVHGSSLYYPNDQWSAYLADETTCPGGERTDLPLAQQAQTMTCLVNYARRMRGLQPLAIVPLLDSSSIAKANRIVRCQQFAHDACNEDPAADARAAGYQGEWGENLYLGPGRWGAPRVALDGWLNSPGHRENLFRPEWRTEGIAVDHLDDFGQFHDAELWVQEFGTS